MSFLDFFFSSQPFVPSFKNESKEVSLSYFFEKYSSVWSTSRGSVHTFHCLREGPRVGVGGGGVKPCWNGSSEVWRRPIQLTAWMHSWARELGAVFNHCIKLCMRNRDRGLYCWHVHQWTLNSSNNSFVSEVKKVNMNSYTWMCRDKCLRLPLLILA